jgi:hypothetical protein
MKEHNSTGSEPNQQNAQPKHPILYFIVLVRQAKQHIFAYEQLSIQLRHQYRQYQRDKQNIPVVKQALVVPPSQEKVSPLNSLTAKA